MLSKSFPTSSSSDGRTTMRGRSAASAHLPPRELAANVAKEIQARVGVVVPLFDGSCGSRMSSTARALPADQEAPTIRTMVEQRRRGLLGIQTTVSHLRRSRQPWPQSSAATKCAPASAAIARSFVGDVPSESVEPCSTLALVPAPDLVKEEEEARRKERMMAIAKDAACSFAPLFIMAPLKLLSPWSSLGGVSMAMMAPPGGAPPGFGAMGPPGMPKEEEQFMELIFPGFASDAFVWQMTMWQVTEFVISMCLGHVKANPTPCVLYRLGASWGPAIARGQIWRLITPVFLHANLTHLLFNVFFQLRMGFGMERQFGRDKMMLIYFVCGVFGNLMSISVDPFKLAVGASTAGFGLIGVWLAEILLSWEILGPARERTVIWIVFMLVSVTTMSTMTPNMDLWGHLGGALGGFLLSIVISDMKEQDRPEWYSQARAAAALGLALFLTGALSKILLVGPRTPIPDCPAFFGLEHLIPKDLHSMLPKVAAAAAS